MHDQTIGQTQAVRQGSMKFLIQKLIACRFHFSVSTRMDSSTFSGLT